MRYFFKNEVLELEIKNYPKKYPVIFLFTDEDINKLRKLITKTELMGISQVDKRLHFGNKAFNSPYKNYKELLAEVFKPMDEKYPFEEVSGELYKVISQIEAWNPVSDLLKKFSFLIDSATELKLEKNELEKILSEYDSANKRFN